MFGTRFDKEKFFELAKPYCHVNQLETWNVFVAHLDSFQNTHSMKEMEKEHGITIFPNNTTGEYLNYESYEKLFDARHIIVHSANDVALNIQKYMKPTMEMFRHVMSQIDYYGMNFDSVHGYALNAVRRHAEAKDVLIGVVSRGTDDGFLYLRLGESCFAVGDKDAAKKYLGTALGIALRNVVAINKEVHASHGIDISDSRHSTAVLCCFLGGVFWRNECPDPAAKCFEAALNVCPDNYTLCELIGAELLGMGMIAQATSCFEKVCAKYPNNAYVCAQLELCYGVSDPVKAKEYAQKASELGWKTSSI